MKGPGGGREGGGRRGQSLSPVVAQTKREENLPTGHELSNKKLHTRLNVYKHFKYSFTERDSKPYTKTVRFKI